MTSLIPLSPDLFIGFVLYKIVGAATPGPATIMVMTNGANFGFIRTLPAVCGITMSMLTMSLLGYLVLLNFLLAHPNISVAITTVGVIFMLHLSWRLIKNFVFGLHTNLSSGQAAYVGFWKSFGMQMTNPKIITVVITMNTTYMKHIPLSFYGLVFIIITLVVPSFPCTACWAFIGSGPRYLLQKGNRLTWFNAIMGVILALTACQMAYEAIQSYR